MWPIKEIEKIDIVSISYSLWQAVNMYRNSSLININPSEKQSPTETKDKIEENVGKTALHF